MENFHCLKIAYKIETKDKKFKIKCTTHKDMLHTLGKKGSNNVLKNAPDLQRAAKRVQRPIKVFSLLISDEMLNDVAEYTNSLIEKFIVDHCEVIQNSEKHSFYKPVDLTDIKAFLGLLYLRARVKLNLFDLETFWPHETSNNFFEATISFNCFTSISKFITFDDRNTCPE